MILALNSTKYFIYILTCSLSQTSGLTVGITLNETKTWQLTLFSLNKKFSFSELSIFGSVLKLNWWILTQSLLKHHEILDENFGKLITKIHFLITDVWALVQRHLSLPRCTILESDPFLKTIMISFASRFASSSTQRSYPITKSEKNSKSYCIIFTSSRIIQWICLEIFDISDWVFITNP